MTYWWISVCVCDTVNKCVSAVCRCVWSRRKTRDMSTPWRSFAKPTCCRKSRWRLTSVSLKTHHDHTTSELIIIQIKNKVLTNKIKLNSDFIILFYFVILFCFIIFSIWGFFILVIFLQYKNYVILLFILFFVSILSLYVIVFFVLLYLIWLFYFLLFISSCHFCCIFFWLICFFIL